MSQHSSQTTDHDKIKNWVESRRGKPAAVKGTRDSNDAGLIRIDMPGYTGDQLEEIGWDEWFQKFEESKLAFLYQDETAEGEKSNFNKLISRD